MHKKAIPYPIVEVIWDDAASTQSGAWVAISEIVPPERINSTGFMVKDCPTYVSITSSVAAEGESETVTSTVTIPRGMIVSIREVKLTNARRKSQDRLHTKPATEEVH
jgi:hypothetical protein